MLIIIIENKYINFINLNIYKYFKVNKYINYNKVNEIIEVYRWSRCI